jgi:hypothetical protein
MLLVAPGYQLLSSGKLVPAAGGCQLVSGGQLRSDGTIAWDHEALRNPFTLRQERAT